MITTPLGMFDDDKLIERRIKYLRNERVRLGNEIEKIKLRYPRCPYCEKRYYIGKYKYYFPFLKNYIPGEMMLRCTLGHDFGIKLDKDIDDFEDYDDFLKAVGEKVEDLDYGYMD